MNQNLKASQSSPVLGEVPKAEGFLPNKKRAILHGVARFFYTHFNVFNLIMHYELCIMN